MPQICKVCTHKEKREIELALIRGESKTALSRTYSISRECLYNHQANHIGAQLVAGTNLAARNHGSRLLESLDDLVMTARKILREAEQDGHRKTALMALKEARSSLVAIAGITHSMWMQQQKESQTIIVQQQDQQQKQMIKEGLKALTPDEVKEYQRLNLKMLTAIGNKSHYNTIEEDTTQIDPIPTEHEISPILAPYEIHVSPEVPEASPRMRRSKPRKSV